MAVRIYTKGGDKGMTGLHGGQRVPKDDLRIETIGSLDEFNSLLGVVRSFMKEDDARHDIFYRIQKELMVVMSLVATRSIDRDKNPNKFDETIVQFCEAKIDEIVEAMPENEYFVLPGGNLISSHLHWARTVVRKSERRMWTLNNEDELPEMVLKFVNRLSDLLFVMARQEMLNSGRDEEKWHKFLYKKKRK
ncbi:cob(I)yrinic acid a,c-diamide adenosyltransferase [Bacteroides propionicifaciens]|uniref:cob(I)yrinic acid a,c-diamide adenosyltransferase n=1 Tax=Bacteroides propionicifaciens TaxID=392838 RepID=UPI000376D44E|nr:cob(I)yrinic acid a,c-diamide adenosyltransferase [Bacteroides propionicifaciens]